MRESYGSVFLYNMIIIFIVITFAFLLGIMNYAKTFRVNSKIVNAIETYEGYNSSSSNEIARILSNFGYQRGNASCPFKDNWTLINYITPDTNVNHMYCVYATVKDDRHYSYGVLTYMKMDIPIIQDILQVPIFSETDTIYYFRHDNKSISEWLQ